MDLSFVVSPLLQLLGTIVLGLAGALITFAMGWIKKKTQLEDAQFEGILAARANDIVHRGIQYAITTLQNEAEKPGSGITSVKVDNIFLRLVVDYARRSMPDIIARFNLTPERIQAMVLSRIGEHAVPIAGGAPTGGAVAAAKNQPSTIEEPEFGK